MDGSKRSSSNEIITVFTFPANRHAQIGSEMIESHRHIKSLARPLLPLMLALALTHCAYLSPKPAETPASRLVSAEGTASPDDVPSIQQTTSHPLQRYVDDQVLQSYGRQDLIVQFKYDREKIPSLPEIEELQTLFAARVRCYKLMAEKIYHLPLERRQTLGPAVLDPSPDLKARLEFIVTDQGRLEVIWNTERTQVEGRYIVPGKAVVEAIQQYLREEIVAAPPAAPGPGFREASPEQRLRLARERAIESARVNLRERLLAQPVRSNQTLDDFIKRNPTAQASLDNFVRSAPLKSERKNPDGSVTVVIEADAGRLMDLLR